MAEKLRAAYACDQAEEAAEDAHDDAQRNWVRVSESRAPIASRIPISRVRSVCNELHAVDECTMRSDCSGCERTS